MSQKLNEYPIAGDDQTPPLSENLAQKVLVDDYCIVWLIQE